VELVGEEFRDITTTHTAYVFDISETNSVELPAMRQVEGDPGDNIKRLVAFLKSRRIQVFYRDDLKGAMGANAGGRIFLLNGHSNIKITERYADLARAHIMKTGSVSREFGASWNRSQKGKRVMLRKRR